MLVTVERNGLIVAAVVITPAVAAAEPAFTGAVSRATIVRANRTIVK